MFIRELPIGPRGRLLFSSLLLVVMAPAAQALRSGAPALACINLRPLHGLHQAKPASASQFFVSQSSLSYEPNHKVTVEIATHSNERHFRGFMLQAYDPVTGNNIGHFAEGPGVRTINSCSAVTHRDNTKKQSVQLTWVPPGSNETGAASSSGTADATSLINQLLGQPRTQVPSTLPLTTASSSDPLAAVKKQQVRFRATIVCSYDDFYTGFESSDEKFDRFDYAMPAPSTAARAQTLNATGGIGL